jgi:hypothetical protein
MKKFKQAKITGQDLINQGNYVRDRTLEAVEEVISKSEYIHPKIRELLIKDIKETV